MTEVIDLATPEGRAAWIAILSQETTRRRSKFGNIPTPVDAGMADSKAEARRWEELRLQERAGVIQDLRFHPRYTLAADIVYEADSSYTEQGRQIVEDVKGGRATQTPAFKMKAKLFRVAFPDAELRIVER